MLFQACRGNWGGTWPSPWKCWHPFLARSRHSCEGCLYGDTQNPNETLHSKIWRKCPKTSFVGLQRVVAATCSGMAEFNSGIELSVQKLFSTMDIVPGRHLVASAVNISSSRCVRRRPARKRHDKWLMQQHRTLVLAETMHQVLFRYHTEHQGALCVYLVCHMNITWTSNSAHLIE